MAIPQEILDDVIRGKRFYSDINNSYLTNQSTGCGCCEPSNYTCLNDNLRSLDYKIALDEYDDVTIDLHKQLIFIIGNYTPVIFPKVNAGADQVKQLPISTGTLTGTVIVGTFPIASYLWTKVSGGNIVFDDPTLLSTGYSGLVAGTYSIKLTVTDTMGNSASDTLKITALANVGKIYYAFQDTITPPTEAEILTLPFISYSEGSDYVVPWDLNTVTPKYCFAFEPIAEPLKTKWQDVEVSANNGNIGAPSDMIAVTTVGGFRVYYVQYITVFENGIELKIS